MNKSPYHITPDELIFLLGLLDIQPRTDSVLADWLSSINSDLLAAQDNLEPARALMEKGWVWFADQVWHMDDELARSLELINQASTRAVFHLQQGETVTAFNYAQFQEECCRYYLAEGHFSLSAPESTQGIEQTLLPDEYQPAGKHKFREELDLPTLFVLIEVCWQSMLGGLDGQADQSFTMEDLIRGLEISLVENSSRPWLGLELEVDLDKLPLHTIVQDLLDRDLLQNLPDGRLRLTAASDSLNLILSDPNLLGLSCLFHNPHTSEIRTASWLFGAEELLQIEGLGEGRYRVSTLFAVEIAREWIQEAWKAFAAVEAPPPLEAAEQRSPASRTLSPQSKGRGKLPIWARLLRGLAGTVLSALIIGLLSSTVIGLIQGELEVNQLTDRFYAGLSTLAGEFGEFNLPLSEAAAPRAGDALDDQGRAAEDNEPRSGTEDQTAPVSSGEEEQTGLPQVRVKESRLAQNGFEDWFALGILKNDSEQPLSKVNFEVQLLDASGGVVYRKTAVTRTMLHPGGQTSFDTNLQGWEGNETDLQLKIIPLSAEILEDYQPVQLQLGNFQLQSERTGKYAVLVGEMINPTQEMVTAEMSALLRDGDGQLTAGHYIRTLQEILLPGERVPFRFVFYPREPVSSLSFADNLEFFIVGAAAEDSLSLPAVQGSPEPQAYWDTAGRYHLLGRVVNQEEEPQEIILIGSVYDQQGRVIDTCRVLMDPPVLPPGGETHYDMSCWLVLPRLGEDPDIRGQVSRFDVVLDRSWALREGVRPVTDLEVRDLEVETIEGIIRYTGSAAGSVPEDASLVTVVVRLIDRNDGSLAAVHKIVADRETLTFNSRFALPESYPEMTPNLKIETEAYAY